MIFNTTDKWKSDYPGASAGVLVIHGAPNQAGDPAVEGRKAEIEAQLHQRYGGMDRPALEALPTLLAYKAYYRRFNKTYHVQLQLESIVFKNKSIPGGSGLVAAMFMAELKNQLLTAGHDLDEVQPPVKIDVADGSEHYILYNGQDQALKPGDMYIADSLGILSNIIYGPGQRSLIGNKTQNVLYTVYAPPGIDPIAVHRHLEDIQANVSLFAPQAATEQLEVYQA